jgi:hypothetical protein
VDGDSEDAVGDGRRDEFADGEFFGVEDAKSDEEGRRISLRSERIRV